MEVVFSSTGDRSPQQGDALCPTARKPQNGLLSNQQPSLPLTEAQSPASRVPRSEPRHPIASALRAALGSIYAALFPSECRFCGIPLVDPSTLPVCQSCLDAITPVEIPRCCLCGEALVAGYRTQLGEARCNHCSRVPPLFARAVAYGAYDGALRDLVHMLKYHRIEKAGDVLGRMLAETIAPLEPEFRSDSAASNDQADILVIPVPLHRTKLNQRGFNQSEILATAALKQLQKRPSAPPYRIESAALVRKRATESQVGMTREQRVANMRGAFAVLHKDRVAGHSVLLVDDVFTTGTTVGECSRVLLEAGARTIWVATVARVLKETETDETIQQQREEEALALAAHAP